VTKDAGPLLDRLGVCINVPLPLGGFLTRGSEMKEKRTILAVVTASVISLVIWGLVVVLNVR
jgi:hypothetical protein